ncbi:DUF3052 domain-containing protein [Microvirga sp. Mcv34]|uniref:DUF3052 domain-containing protein n=1 Tax=Microvirga sp. Mcv34 TaxID=2926016 RepID=UPI0021CA1A69|nr:DUF3052 domain-containing protein [Microvirga sp. Mcv34]
MSAGYSGTPLPKKLGFRDGQRAAFIGLPNDLSWLAGSVDLQEAWLEPAFTDTLPHGLDVVHLFTVEAEPLGKLLDGLKQRIVPNGMIWVSWPKKSAKVPTDVTEDVIRSAALGRGLVDVKVCAVDAVWSGLKLVIPKALRAATS